MTENKINWKRSTTKTGLPVYEANGYRIEADSRLSQHVGVVFGHISSEAGREPRIVGWKGYSPEGKRIGLEGKLKDVKASCERRMISE